MQVSAHGIHVTRWGLAQAAVYGRLGLLQTLQSITHIAGMARTAPCVLGRRAGRCPLGTGGIHCGPPPQPGSPAHWASTQAVGMLTAAPSMAIFTGIAGPAAPAITLIVWQAGTGDHCPYLATVGMFTAAATPILAQVRHYRQGESGWTKWREGNGASHLMSIPTCSPVHVWPSPS